MQIRLQFTLVIIVGMTHSAFALAEPNNWWELGDRIIRNYLPEEYGGSDQVWAIAEDPRGVMFFGTSGEVLEFDGVKWRRHELPRGITVRSLAIDTEGKIFVGAIGEIGFFAPNGNGSLIYVSLNDKLPKDYKFQDVWNLKITSHGVYFFTSEETFRWHNDQLEVLPSFDTATVVSSNSIIGVTDDGIAKLSENGIEIIKKVKFSTEEFGPVWPALFPKKDKILLVSRKKGLLLFSIEDLSISPFEYDQKEYLLKNQIYAVAPLANNLLALGTRLGGIVILDEKGNLVQFINESNGLSTDGTSELYQDRNRNLWVATQKGIAYIHLSSPVTFFAKHSGIKSSVTCVVRHENGIYVGTMGQGALKLLPDTNFKETCGRSFVSLKRGAPGSGWDLQSVGKTLLVADIEVARIDGDKQLEIENTPIVYDLFQSKKYVNRIYLGITPSSGGGLGLIEVQKEQTGAKHNAEHISFIYKGKLGNIEAGIRHVVEDNQGNLWLSTMYSGAIRVLLNSESLDNIEVQEFSTIHGLPAMEGNFVYNMDGEILAATRKGIYKYRPPDNNINGLGRFVPHTAINQGLGSVNSKINGIIKYGSNKWLVRPVGRFGILELDEKGIYRSDNRLFRGVGEKDNRLHIDADNVVWIATSKGLYRYDPKVNKKYDTAYSTLIRRVTTMRGRELFGGAKFERSSLSQPHTLIPTLEYSDNGLVFEYSALFFEYPKKTLYQTKLEGFDTDWSKPSNNTHKEYFNLREGNYKFQVRAKNIYDTLSSEAVYSFKILQPWYRTKKMYAAYLLGFILLFLGGIRLATWRLNAAKRRLEKIVKRRTKEVVEQRDEIEEARNALWGEMELAKKIQTVLLPKEPHIPGYEVTGYMQTADEVGGDYYDVINTKNKNWVVIGDVTGHGVPAGLVMMMVQSIINYAVDSHENESLDQILKSINRTIYQNVTKLGETKYMTLTLMSIGANGDVVYSGLHEDILVYRKETQEVEIIETRGIWLALAEDISGMNYIDNFRLEPGDTMLLFTDGIVEAMNQDSELYETKRLKSIFKKCGDRSNAEIRDFILDSLRGFSVSDDVTLLLVKRKTTDQA